MAAVKRVNNRVVLMFILALAFVYALALNPGIDMGGDSTNYILLARSLLQGTGYVDIFRPDPVAHTGFPPFFPLVLSAVMFFAGADLLVLKFVPLLCMCAAVYVFARLLKEYDKEYDFGTIPLFALNCVIFTLAVTLMSEAVYILFSFLSLLMLHKYARRSSALHAYGWLTVLSLIAAFYTRTVGVALFPALVGFLLCKRLYKKALFIATAGALGMAPWFIRGSLCGSGYITFLFRGDRDAFGPQVITIGAFVSRCLHNLLIYVAKVPADTFFFPFFYNVAKDHPAFGVKITVSAVLFALIVYGYLKRVKKNCTGMDVYVPVFFIICVCWPVHGPRFIIPVFGFFVYYAMTALVSLAGKKRSLVTGVFILLLIPAVAADLQYIAAARFRPYSLQEARYLDAVSWLKAHSPADAVVMCRKPQITYLLSGRRALYYPDIMDENAIMAQIRDTRVRYVILDTLGKDDARYGMWSANRYLMPVIQKYPATFARVYSSAGPDENHVYRVVE